MDNGRDGLTGLHWPVYILAQLEQAIAEAKQQGVTAALLFADIDNFGDFNCSLGHDVGDRMLCHLADVVQWLVGDKGTVCRYATDGPPNFGDVFLVALPGASITQAKEVADQIREQTGTQPMVAYEREVYVTLTIGVASYPANGQDAESLLQAAKEAVRQSIKSGPRNTTITA